MIVASIITGFSGIAMLVHHKWKYNLWLHRVGKRPMLIDHGTYGIISLAIGLIVIMV